MSYSQLILLKLLLKSLLFCQIMYFILVFNEPFNLGLSTLSFFFFFFIFPNQLPFAEHHLFFCDHSEQKSSLPNIMEYRLKVKCCACYGEFQRTDRTPVPGDQRSQNRKCPIDKKRNNPECRIYKVPNG